MPTNEKLGRQGRVRDRGGERHRPRGGAGVRARGRQRRGGRLSEPGNQETVRLIEEAGGRALAVACDVSRDEDVKAALDKTVEAFGGSTSPSTMPASSSRCAGGRAHAKRSGTGSSTSTSAACSCA